jgi:hypothetical protein
MGDEHKQAVLVQVPTTTDEPPAEMPEALVGVYVAEAVERTAHDPRIAWAVLHELHEARLLGPWEENPGQKDCWVRRNSYGFIEARVWWERGEDGELVERDAGRGHIHLDPARAIYETEPRGWPKGKKGWKVSGLRGTDSGPYSTPAEAMHAAEEFLLGERCYPTVAVALIWTDSALKKIGWTPVPPFGRILDD